MSMKRTDLAKSVAIKVRESIKKAPVPGRFGVVSAAVPDRREQRRLDQAAGLVPFACKLKDELVQQLRSLAEQDGGDVSALTERLIRAGLNAEGLSSLATQKATPKAAKPSPVVAKKAVIPKAPKAAEKAAEKVAVSKPAAAKKAAVKTSPKSEAKPAAKKKAKPA